MRKGHRPCRRIIKATDTKLGLTKLRGIAYSIPNFLQPKEERRILIEKLNEIDPGVRYFETLEEENIYAYDTTIKRLKPFTDLKFAKELEKEIKGRIMRRE